MNNLNISQPDPDWDYYEIWQSLHTIKNKIDAGIKATVHLVWIPCRRRKIFANNEELKLRCIQIFQSVANDNKWVIKAMEVAPDHVHLLVEYDPHHSISQVVKAFKGRSSRYLRQEFPELMRLPSLWTHSDMFDTTGKVSTQKVLEYINDPHHG
ncbi:MAG: IS200/IS605 family transposase [Nostoc sp.]